MSQFKKDKYQISINILKNSLVSLAMGSISSHPKRLRVGDKDGGSSFHLDLDFELTSPPTQVHTSTPCLWASRIAPVIVSPKPRTLRSESGSMMYFWNRAKSAALL